MFGLTHMLSLNPSFVDTGIAHEQCSGVVAYNHAVHVEACTQLGMLVLEVVL